MQWNGKRIIRRGSGLKFHKSQFQFSMKLAWQLCVNLISDSVRVTWGVVAFKSNIFDWMFCGERVSGPARHYIGSGVVESQMK